MRHTALGAAMAVLAFGGLTEALAHRLTVRRPPDPTDHPRSHDTPHEEITFPARDGLPLAGWWLPAPGAPAPTVVVVSGQNGSMDGDLPAALRVQRAGFNVLLYDARGHGRSGGAAVTLGPGEVCDLRGALDWVVSRSLGPVGVLGFSLGGAVALTTAALDRRVAAVVADGAFARVSDVVAAALHERGVPALLARPLVHCALWRAGQRTGAPLTLAEPARWAGRLRAPTLLLHGTADRYVATATIRALAASLAAPHALLLFPGADHREAATREPGRYWEALLGWFERFLRQALP